MITGYSEGRGSNEGFGVLETQNADQGVKLKKCKPVVYGVSALCYPSLFTAIPLNNWNQIIQLNIIG